MKASILPTLLTVAAFAAVPAGASAATVVGPDVAGATAAALTECPDPQMQPSCTYIQESAVLPSGKRIVAWSGNFAAGSMVRLQVLKANGDDTFTPLESSVTEYPTGGVQAFTTDVPVPADGKYVLGVDLYSGAVGIVANPAARLIAAEEVIYFGSAGTGPASARELQLNAVIGDGTPVTPPGDTTDDGPVLPPNDSTDTPQAGFSIQPRSLLEADGRTIGVYTSNELDKMIDGSIRLQVGKTTFKAAAFDEYDYHDAQDFSVPIAGGALKKLMKRGKLSGTVIAKTTGGTFKQKVKIARGGASGYDGEYRGPGPLIIVVKRGVITTVNENLNLFCPRSNATMTRAMSAVPGPPVLVKRDGSFTGRASRSTDLFHYKGVFTKSGTVRGYLSLFHTNVATSGGSLVAEQCYQAHNFTAKR